jgi:energy-coupling factor transporter ATP-binding protein EcfA2
VLEIIGKHEGEGVYNEGAPIYAELKERFPKEMWGKSENGEFRPLFRDYPNSWTRPGVVSLEGQKFALTALGKQVINGEIDPSEAFIRMMIGFVEGDTRPFAILASAFLVARRKLSIYELYWGVVRNYRPGADDLEAALATAPDANEIGDTEVRRLKSLLKLMVSVNAIVAVDKDNWIPWDYSTLQRLAGPTTPQTSASAPNVSLRTLATTANVHFEEAGFVFPNDLVGRFAASLLAKRFLILTGLSGSGKTSIARAFARWMSHVPDQYAMIRVGANWTSGDVLLGYPDALNNSRYQGTQTLNLLLRAINRPQEPHFLILDEMNLSHVERYFADFLSAIETPKDAMSLYSSNEERDGVPYEIFLPANLFIIGTVNVDETTFMFSPKVLDRANVIEFRTSGEVINSFLDQPRHADVEQFAGLGEGFAPAFITEASATAEISSLQAAAEAFKAEVKMLFTILAKHDMEFGLRTAWEMTRYLHFAIRLAEDPDADRLVMLRDSLDIQILQKLLPRIHGSRRRVEPSLRSLFAYCSAPHDWDETGLLNADQILTASTEAARSTSALEQVVPPTVFYSRSANKLHRMLQRCIRDGFVNFAEA